MKKILAILLAVLMLGSATAFAETSPCFSASDPVVHVEQEGSIMDINLAGLEFRIGTMPAGENGLLLNVLAEGELLFKAQLRVEDNGVVLSADGLSHSYRFPLPGGTPSAQAGSGISSSAPAIDFKPVIEALLSESQINSSPDGVEFDIPYTAVLNALDQLLDMIPISDQEQLDTLREELNKARESKSGPSFIGSVENTETGINAELNVFMVSNGIRPVEPTAVLRARTTREGTATNFTGEMEAQGSMVFRFAGRYTDGRLDVNLDADPDQDGSLRMVANLQAEWGDGAFYLSLTADQDNTGTLSPIVEIEAKTGDTFSFRANLLNRFGLEATATSNSLSLTVSVDTYGMGTPFPVALLSATWGDGEFHLSLNAMSVVGLNVDFSAESQELKIDANVQGSRYSVRVKTSVGEAELVACGPEGPVLDFNGLTDEEKDALSGELQNALMPLLQFIASRVNESQG